MRKHLLDRKEAISIELHAFTNKSPYINAKILDDFSVLLCKKYKVFCETTFVFLLLVKYKCLLVEGNDEDLSFDLQYWNFCMNLKQMGVV
ncbi:hypothetical protein ADM90_13580 [Lysinibacillus macroides]|uniref:Uncharacterized protein n=1 Tax=Lysinibacillus macroides TaxID=33935 RepID=A0A0M9DJX1_9BACI|nr:hypothetical protein ADM90_13580 [Lysinibacillus macroides]